MELMIRKSTTLLPVCEVASTYISYKCCFRDVLCNCNYCMDTYMENACVFPNLDIG